MWSKEEARVSREAGFLSLVQVAWHRWHWVLREADVIGELS